MYIYRCEWSGRRLASRGDPVTVLSPKQPPALILRRQVVTTDSFFDGHIWTKFKLDLSEIIFDIDIDIYDEILLRLLYFFY